MANLRVHLIYGKEIHLEGEDEIVKQLLEKYGPITSASVAEPSPEFSLPQVVSQSLASSEPEWVLIYACSFTKPQFTRFDILSAYKSTQRYSSNRSKNLSFNIRTCIKYGWFNAISSTNFSVSPQGKIHLQEILTRHK